MMRVTGGIARGMILKAPKSRATRPTTDMVRNAVFAMLETAPDWSRGLDLFAGSGALGIEALSRGVEWVDFVDQQPQACAIIKDNLKATDLTARSHVYCAAVSSALGFLKHQYGIVLIDPPYAQASLIEDLLRNLAESQLVSENAYIAVCHSSRSPLEERYENLNAVRQRRYGDTSVSIYHKEAEN